MDKDLSRYTSFYVRAVKSIKKGYGYIVILVYPDGSTKTQQISGFKTKAEANKARTLTYAELHNHTYPVYRNITVLLNVLMGLRRSEILGLKYSDIDFDKHTLKVVRQLGRRPGSKKEDCAPKTFTKQEIHPKTRSSIRELPIPDLVYEAILEERERYETNRSRRKASFQDLDYICCSSYGRPRCSTFHQERYKKLLKECGLPDIRWHDLRATYCTMLLKNNFSPKAVSILMGHAKEIVTVDVYGDNKGILIDGVPEMDEYIRKLLPERME